MRWRWLNSELIVDDALEGRHGVGRRRRGHGKKHFDAWALWQGSVPATAAAACASPDPISMASQTSNERDWISRWPPASTDWNFR